VRRHFALQLLESFCVVTGPAVMFVAIISIILATGPGQIVTFLTLSLCLIGLHACVAHAKSMPSWEMETDKSHEAIDAGLTLRTEAIPRWPGEDTGNDLDAL
jgi:hypothetical protein